MSEKKQSVMTDFFGIKRPKKCPFLLNQYEMYGENKNRAQWECEIEKIGMDNDCIERCTTDFEECVMFSKGIHYRDVPKACPCADVVNNNICTIPDGVGEGCMYRHRYEYHDCARFSEWYYKKRV